VTARQAYQQAEQKGFEVISIGITNQRETILIWERDTLAMIYPAIVWQDRRTVELRKALKNAGHEEMVTQETGLLLDPYFSASKVYWILHEVENPTTTTTLSLAGALPNHFTTSTTFNKLFYGDIIYSTNSDKRIDYDSDDNLDSTLTGTGLLGTVFDVYWDNE
jgi:glycerol kinase